MLFFFFKQKTAYEMRISDWSSDVCSSDLRLRRAEGEVVARLAPHLQRLHAGVDASVLQAERARQVVEQAVAAALGLQRQHEGAVPLDVDGLDGVHLDGDGQTHGDRFLSLVLERAPR